MQCSVARAMSLKMLAFINLVLRRLLMSELNQMKSMLTVLWNSESSLHSHFSSISTRLESKKNLRLQCYAVRIQPDSKGPFTLNVSVNIDNAELR